jgi:hypothetical protein
LAMSKKYNKIKGLDKSAKLEDMIVKTGIKHDMKKLHSSAYDTQATFKLHKFLKENGVDDLEFIKASKNYIDSIKSTATKSLDDLAQDAVMDELFDFSGEE